MSGKQLYTFSLLRKWGIDYLGSTLDPGKEISEKVPGGFQLLSLLLLFYSLDTRCSRVWDWHWGENCTAARFPTPLCYLKSQEIWASVYCWKHMLKSMMAPGTAATSWWMATAGFVLLSSPPLLHTSSVSRDFKGSTCYQLQGLQSIFSIRKNTIWVFSHFIEGDLGVLIKKKKSNCIVRVSLRAGILPVKSL